MYIQVFLCEIPQTAAEVIIHTLFFFNLLVLLRNAIYMEAVKCQSKCKSLGSHRFWKFWGLAVSLILGSVNTGL